MTAGILRRLFTCPQWFIAYRKRKSLTLPFDMRDFQVIEPPRGRFYADPFPIRQDGKDYIFFEEYCFLNQKGFISFVEIDRDGGYSKPQKVLERPYHLSYPCLFTWQDKIYMIPETGSNGTIELYAARNFPYDWTLERVLMRGIRANDTTILVHGNKVWLFTAVDDDGDELYTKLCLFYADSIFGPWQAHPRNPIVDDVASARSAGKLFWHDGELIRPSQNCSAGYGHALVFNKLTRLTEEEYSEQKIAQIEPSWYPGNRSCHTYNFNDELEVIDGEVINTDLMKPYRKLAEYFRRGLNK